MELLDAFPDAEMVALDLLTGIADTVLATPATLRTPLIVLRRTGGADDLITDIPRIQVDCFGTNRRQAADLAERCRQRILAAPATGIGDVSIDQTWTETAPVFAAYGDLNVQRYVATYRIALRRSR